MKKFVLMLVAVFMLQISFTAAAFAKDRLYPGETLTKGQSLVSNNGRFELRFQFDGNLVLYKDNTKAIWASGTNGACFRNPGDPLFGDRCLDWPTYVLFTPSRAGTMGLVISNNTFNSYQFWATDNAGWINNSGHYSNKPKPENKNANILIVQDDGNVVLYNESPYLVELPYPVWATNTGGQ
ncbi:hypothetical protein [Paenibacillus mucilaginosus]|uniref:hypothetical protein n=1 Tax=Paenibacillus mucilaginosus TaxID=61624 RepID=UPI0005A03689|nr:hypothetical protein [Paenibacillus mucilaginosus]MCG7216881.1 hypothetical protein [Paenibacillus mucilaginosus]WDM30977.1 hypothetical protein KCX80_18285 [Paenibacillus mucilaginosus]